MKKERKLKLMVNKITVSKLNHIFGGNERPTEDTRVDTCTETGVTNNLTCTDTRNDCQIIKSDPCQTGDTKSDDSKRACFNDSVKC